MLGEGGENGGVGSEFGRGAVDCVVVFLGLVGVGDEIGLVRVVESGIGC